MIEATRRIRVVRKASVTADIYGFELVGAVMADASS